jgi:hypothetical protein
VLCWLVYEQERLRTVLIVEASFIGEGRLRADVEIIPGVDVHFIEGHELGPEWDVLVPPDMIGRMLSADQARHLLDRHRQRIPKKPPAPSVRRAKARRPSERREQ